MLMYPTKSSLNIWILLLFEMTMLLMQLCCYIMECFDVGSHSGEQLQRRKKRWVHANAAVGGETNAGERWLGE